MPTSPRSRRKAERPAEVLEAALDAFVDKGFAGTRMDDIAARAGVSKGTLYLYYSSKEAIFEALVRQTLLPNLERIESIAANEAASPADLLRHVLTMAGELMTNLRIIAIPKLVLAEAGNFPDMARFYRREVVGRGLGMIEALLRRGIARGQFRVMDPHIAARLFMAPAVLSALWQTAFAPIEDAPVSPAEVLRLHAELFLRAIEVPK